MARSKKGAKRPNQPKGSQKKQVRAVVPRALRASIDRQAMAYAELLKDPCSGPLVHSTYAGAGGSLITRFEFDFIANTGATETASFGYFCPGFVVNNATFNSVGFTPAATPLTNDGVTATCLNTLVAQQPGYSFLYSNAAVHRSVAACIQISWPGTEYNRGGIMAVGQTTLNQFAAGTVSAAQLRTLATHVERTPDGVIEIKMVPNDESENWLSPIWGTAPEGGMQDLPTLFWSAAGLTAGTGVRVRMVNVVEWKPKSNTGMMINSASQVANVSTNTTQNVLKYMYQFGEWAINSPTIQRVGKQLGNRLISGVAAGARNGFLLGI